MALRQQGYEVHAISPSDEYASRLRQMGVLWHPLALHQTGRNPLKEIRTLGQLCHHLRTIAPQVVLSYTIKCNLYAGLLRYFLQFRLIPTISGLGEGFDKQGWLRNILQLFYAITLRQAHRVFFQNEEDLQILTMRHLIPKALCERIPGSGVDIVRFAPHGDRLHHSRRRFLMFGRIVPKKGYDVFLEVARRVQEQSPEAGDFWILGIEDRSRPESLRLLKRIQEFHAQHIVTYFSARHDVLPLLQQSDVVVLPSQYHEGVPRCLLEGMACGKPVITTDWKGCRDTVDHQFTGLLVDPGNIDDFYHAVQFFLRASDETIQRMGIAARKKVVREFDERQIIKKYLTAIIS